MQNSKPYIQAACVCEKILLEDGKVPSLIRLIDVVHLDFSKIPDVQGAPKGMEYSIFIGLKSGDLKGDFQLGIRLRRPDGGTEKTEYVPVNFQGGGHGNNIRLNAVLIDPTNGLYWTELLWGEEILTRIPLEIRITQAAGEKKSL